MPQALLSALPARAFGISAASCCTACRGALSGCAEPQHRHFASSQKGQFASNANLLWMTNGLVSSRRRSTTTCLTGRRPTHAVSVRAQVARLSSRRSIGTKGGAQCSWTRDRWVTRMYAHGGLCAIIFHFLLDGFWRLVNILLGWDRFGQEFIPD